MHDEFIMNAVASYRKMHEIICEYTYVWNNKDNKKNERSDSETKKQQADTEITFYYATEPAGCCFPFASY